MEKTNCVNLELVLLLIFCLCNTSVQCQTRPINHISAEPPSPSRAPELKNKFQKIILSILFGIVTGLICSFLFAFTVRCFVSPNGKYYKTVLDNGLTIAVKRLEPFENGSPQAQIKSVKRRMQQELEMLASLRHRNLMSLRAFVRESDGLCLVYDYMHIGSLEDAMKRVRENQLELRWEPRLRIAVGIVKGLQFLHFSCNPSRVLHYNLKPSNVMLDAEFEPRLADCGLAKMVMPNLDRAPSGYDAPECFQSCNKSDVFSFGVILGVLLTGRHPMDPFFEESASGGSLGRWLRHLQHAGEAREALDKSIIGEEVEEDEMLMAVRISVVCQSDLPADRPSSDELVSMLTQLNSF
ncbi:protein kinase superfamily protein [Actinidia rufa]|uniref:Protein kinase superfamily protein n=1 Tax=Actinidia rufa TaxID=165716 RepID=A0A7J0FMI1_9ERIC|nr:protein kinase superfamily protein [Actinidia rufa]